MPSKTPPATGRRIQTRRSGVHGKGVFAVRDIAAGEELSYDYGLIIDEPYTRKLKAEYPCWCGAATCRGTLLAPKRGWRPPMPGDALPASAKPASEQSEKTKRAKKQQVKAEKPLEKAPQKPRKKSRKSSTKAGA